MATNAIPFHNIQDITVFVRYHDWSMVEDVFVSYVLF